MIRVDSNYNIEMTRGDTFARTLILTKNNEPYEIQQGDVIKFGMSKAFKGERGYKLLLEKIIPNDTLLWVVDANETADMAYGKYYYDLQITYADGKVETFANVKTITLLKEVE